MNDRRCFLSSLPLLALGLASLAGCSGDPDAGKINREENEEEQKLLSDQMRKGFEKKPTTRRK